MIHADHASIRALLSSGRGSRGLEEHLASCDACAEILAQLAREEERLHEVACAVLRAESTTQRRPLWIGAALGAAAAAILLFGTVAWSQPARLGTPTTRPTTLAALDGAPRELDGGVPLARN